MITLTHWINAKPTPSLHTDTLPVYQPSTATVYASCPRGCAADVDAAVNAASAAQPGWSALSASERSQWLNRLANAIERNAEAFVQCESRNTGKPLELLRGIEIPRAIANFRFFAAACVQSLDQAFHHEAGLNYTLHEPLGVVGVISPWNLPLYLLTWKLAPALAAGNCVIGKPSEVTPMSADLLAQTAADIGFPPGVFSIVQGAGPDVGAALVAHPEVKAISFTGSTAVGRRIAQECALHFKKLTLEMGGKNPAVVFADAPENTLPTLVRASFQNAGQICLCSSRLLIQNSIYNEFSENFVAAAKGLRVGPPEDPESRRGPLMSEAHFRKVMGFIELARAEGGTVLCGGHAIPNNGGWYVAPTVIAGLPMSARCCQEEIFGPVVVLHPFNDETEALQLANESVYGLAASVWTSDLSRAHRMGSRLACGIVWINTWMQRDLRTPFGGMKQSGYGREGGMEALRFFTEPKTVCLGTEHG